MAEDELEFKLIPVPELVGPETTGRRAFYVQQTLLKWGFDTQAEFERFLRLQRWSYYDVLDIASP